MNRCLTAFGILLVAISSSQAQWITFTDETASRLQLSQFVDSPGDPLLDDEEKDIGIGDLNGDGRMDAVVVRKRPFSNPGPRQDVLLLNINGKLVDETRKFAPGFLQNLTDARDVFIADFTGDGWSDVVIINTFGQQPRFYRNLGNGKTPPPLGVNPNPLSATRPPAVWRGLVDETAKRFPVIQVPGDVNTIQFCAGWGGDINGDGALDLYLANYIPADGTNDILLVNDGTGVFQNETQARLGNLANVAFGTGVEIHDIDNDGDMDITKTSTLYSAPPYPVGQFNLINNGSGVFTQFQQMNDNQPYMFTLADLNGDGLLDQYLEDDQQDRVAIAQNVGADGLVNYVTSIINNSPRTEGFGGNTKAVDIDGDGDLDVGVAPVDVDIANCGPGENLGFALLRNDGTGTLTDPYASSPTQNFNLSAHDFDCIDLNGDGRLDIIFTLCDGWRVLIQNP